MIGKSGILASLLLALLLISGCATTSTTMGDEPERAVIDNELKAVSFEDYSIKITAAEDFEYTFSRTADPFKVFIELKGVNQGAFTERIIPKKEGISEVAFVNKTLPVKATLIEITLSAPLEVAHSVTGKVLTVSVKRQGGAPSGQALVIPGEDGFVMPETDTAESAPAPYTSDARNVTGLTFKKEDGAVNIVIQGDGTMKPNYSTLRETLFLDIPGVRLAAVMPTELISPLLELKWSEKVSGVRFIMTLDKDTSSKVLTVGDTVIVSLTTTAMVDALMKKKAGVEARRKAAAAEWKKSDAAKAAAQPADGALPPPADVPPPGAPPLPVSYEGDNAAAPAAPAAPVNEVKGHLCGEEVSCGTNNKLLSLDFQSAGIVSVFKVLSDESGCNIVVDPTVQGQITMQVKDASWFQIVDLILKIHSLGCEITGNIIRIAPKAKLDAEKDAEQKRLTTDKSIMDTKEQMEPLVTKIFKINYATVDDIKGLLTSIAPPPAGTPASTTASTSDAAKEAINKATIAKATYLESQYSSTASSSSAAYGGLLSPRGSMTVDKRTSSIIVVDIQRVMNNIEKMIRQLDKPPQQVLIEARIVEVSKGVNDTLGINWGILGYNNTAADSGKKSGLGVGAAEGTLTGNTYLGTLPTVVAGLSGGVALGFINAAQTASLDLKLNALESTNQGKILTNPRLLTLNLQKASISQGESIPYPKMNAQGEISADFKDVTISISVTPQITPDNSIILQLTIGKEDFESSVTIGGSSAPQTSKVAEDTKVLVKDGETLVLGGVFKWKETSGEEGLPLLKDIPVLGWLFKTETFQRTLSEYLIFITPRIVNREADEPS